MSRWDARGTAIAIVVTATLLLTSACVPDTSPPETPVPTVDPAPLFTTEEEALAAAEAVYREYLSIVNTVGQAGGEDSDRLHAVVGGEIRDLVDEEFERMRAESDRVEGDIELVSMSLQQFSSSGATAFACVSYEGVVQVAQDGTVTPLFSEDPVVPLELEFRAVDSSLRLTGQMRWDAQNFC